jgi:hypothetical protein
MAVSFEGFPRTLQRSALRPGRWFVAADGARPLLCLATDAHDADEPLCLAFTTPALEQVDVVAAPMNVLLEPFGTVEDEVVFAPGQLEGAPMLVAPQRRTVRNGVLVRLANGDLGVGVVTRTTGQLVTVSLHSGARCEGFDLVFERWSVSLRRGGAQTLIGYFKPQNLYAQRRKL